MTPGTRVRYRSFAGDVYDATITGAHANGTVSLDIDLPGCREPAHFTHIRPERIEPQEPVGGTPQ